MKIRIKGDSLRYRLTKADVCKFSENGYLEESTNFGTGTLIYALQQYAGNNLSATFEDDKITLFMPATMVKEWALGDSVGFEHQDKALFLLVEKDFKCLDNVAEDQSDNYPNPAVK